MSLYLVTAPTAEPVSVAEAKLHVRQDDADDDELIRSLIVAAREYTENFTRRALMTQTWDLKLDTFPYCDEIWLPKAPAVSVTSITYVDNDGVTQTWSTSAYTTDFPTGPHARQGRIVRAYQQTYPQTRMVVNAVAVRFVCGYGAAAAVPAGIKQAMKLLIGHWYENREAVLTEARMTFPLPTPMAVDSLLWPFKAF